MLLLTLTKFRSYLTSCQLGTKSIISKIILVKVVERIQILWSTTKVNSIVLHYIGTEQSCGKSVFKFVRDKKFTLSGVRLYKRETVDTLLVYFKFADMVLHHTLHRVNSVLFWLWSLSIDIDFLLLVVTFRAITREKSFLENGHD